jgi:hypothetical protein
MKKDKPDSPKPPLKAGSLIGFDIEANADIAAQQAFDRMSQEGFDALTEKERTVAAVWLFEGKVANGGFRGFFSGSAGNLAFYAPAALKNIGAFKMAEIAAQANGVFGAEGPPRDRKARQKLVRAFSEETLKQFEALERVFYECPDDVDALLDAYVKIRPA